MGFTIQADLETSRGKSKEVYLRIQSLNFNRSTMEVRTHITYWENKIYAGKADWKVVTDPKPKLVGLLQEKFILYHNKTEKEVVLPHNLTLPITETKIVEMPVYETVVEEVEIPYVSFNKLGEEITKTKIHKKETQVEIRKEEKQITSYNYSALSNIFEFCYLEIEKIITELIPEAKIIKS